MEFDFNINTLLRDTIEKFDKTIKPPKVVDRESYQKNRRQIMTIIDKMGEASAKAQGLHGPVTSSTKLQISNHLLYIMKDPDANNGRGALLGILKVGYKKLFMYDTRKQQHEMEPLCVLDFYVHESRQRQGCGKYLFDFMLKKHYKLSYSVPQVNNYVVFEGFFKDSNRHLKKRLKTDSPTVFPYRNYNECFQRNAHNATPLDRSNSAVDNQHHSVLSRRNSEVINHQSKCMILSHNCFPTEQDSSNHVTVSQERPSSKILPMPRLMTPSPSESQLMQLDLSKLPMAIHKPQAETYSRHSSTNSKGPKEGYVHNKAMKSEKAEVATPPLLPRENLAHRQQKTHDLNLQREYQGWADHLRLTSQADHSSFCLPSVDNSSLSKVAHSKFVPISGVPPTLHSSWTIFGVPPSHKALAAKHKAHTRLW